MRNLLVLILLIVSVVASPAAQAQKSTSATSHINEDTASDITQLKRDVNTLTNEIAVLRRDQINYRVEKDLLKEAYTSNLQSINITITIVLAVFTIIGTLLGYFGLKSLNDLKAEYARELDSLRTLKTSLEAEFDEFRQKQKSVETQVDVLAKTNREQDDRLKLLEISDRAVQHFTNNNFMWALKFANAALDLKPEDETMLKIKAGSLGRMGDFTAMIDVHNKLLELKPADPSTIVNHAEALALANSLPEFEAWYQEKKAVIDADRPGLSAYLGAIAQLTSGNLTKAKNILVPFVDSCPPGAAPRLGRWEFHEAKIAVSRLTDSPSKKLAEQVLQFIQGGLTKEAMQAQLVA